MTRRNFPTSAATGVYDAAVSMSMSVNVPVAESPLAHFQPTDDGAPSGSASDAVNAAPACGASPPSIDTTPSSFTSVTVTVNVNVSSTVGGSSSSPAASLPSVTS